MNCLRNSRVSQVRQVRLRQVLGPLSTEWAAVLSACVAVSLALLSCLAAMLYRRASAKANSPALHCRTYTCTRSHTALSLNLDFIWISAQSVCVGLFCLFFDAAAPFTLFCLITPSVHLSICFYCALRHLAVVFSYSGFVALNDAAAVIYPLTMTRLSVNLVFLSQLIPQKQGLANSLAVFINIILRFL